MTGWQANKEFYVSPFMNIEGQYRFRIEQQKNTLNFFIDYIVGDKIKLSTYLKCKCKELTNRHLFFSFLNIPFATLKTTALIHYQALKLFFKALKFDPYPEALKKNITIGKNEKENL